MRHRAFNCKVWRDEKGKCKYDQFYRVAICIGLAREQSRRIERIKNNNFDRFVPFTRFKNGVQIPHNIIIVIHGSCCSYLI